MRRRVAGLTAVVAVLLGGLAASPAPAQAGDGHAVTGAEWHRLHPALCHTVGDHEHL
ncbi:MAG: hypothetical protein ABIQ59_11135 [Nocardioidaceae bacterium]